ncbi:MAG: hypothetical protein NVSMB52_07610 [Chloroflexota bacterium]
MRIALIAAITILLGATLASREEAHAHPLTVAHHKTVKALAHGDSYVFKAAVLHIKVGTKVTWINPSDTGHNITAASSNWKIAQDLEQGATVEHTFKKPGTYLYICTLHENMVGKILVSK